MSAYDQITGRILDQLQAGTAPWVKPWRADRSIGSLPQNAVTGRSYHGINTLVLMGAGAHYPSARWLTYKQATDQGGHVRAGEKGAPIVFWKFPARPTSTGGDDSGADDTGSTSRGAPLCRLYFVFNVAQCEGLELPVTVPAPAAPSRPELQSWIDRTGAEIRHGGDRAYYSPLGDYVQLPHATAFTEPDHYWSTALHELVHWSGGERRLARQFGRRFGDQAYAAEELVAEIGSAFLCAAAGVPLEGLQHASYLQSWIKIMQSDNRAIFTAARAAQTAADYLIEKMTGKEPKPEAIAA